MFNYRSGAENPDNLTFQLLDEDGELINNYSFKKY